MRVIYIYIYIYEREVSWRVQIISNSYFISFLFLFFNSQMLWTCEGLIMLHFFILLQLSNFELKKKKKKCKLNVEVIFNGYCANF